jgi:hypothetical protein
MVCRKGSKIFCVEPIGRFGLDKPMGSTTTEMSFIVMPNSTHPDWSSKPAGFSKVGFSSSNLIRSARLLTPDGFSTKAFKYWFNWTCRKIRYKSSGRAEDGNAP